MNSHSRIDVHIQVVNENSLQLISPATINPRLARQLAVLREDIQQYFSSSVIDAVAAYKSILVEFETGKHNIFYFEQALGTFLEHYLFKHQEKTNENTVNIPVYYHPDVGTDLRRIAESARLSIEDVIKLHSEKTYTVYSLGFAPGFAYMGNVDPRIASPRLATPRERVAKGSVGIAGKQTGVYPQSLPGGWNIVGRTPVELFSVSKHGIQCPFSAGCLVKFFPISRDEFFSLAENPNNLEALT